ncbi:MAG: ABC transporter permease [Crocinitomicaceae bacterium]|nr:ABC transporter permease [Crocinitomicaceae bacterium]
MELNKIQNWTTSIGKGDSNSFSFKELWRYRDLLFLFVRRDFVKEFKQTILGPLWFIIQPIFQTIILIFVFGKVGGLGPNGIPQITFYLAGTIVWNLFADCLLKTSEVFRANAGIFTKVYFPRLIMPLSTVFTSYLKVLVQLGILLAVYAYEFIFIGGFEPNFTIVLFPLYLIIASFLGLGMGLIISAMTTKYWDLRFLVQFSIQLLMFLSAVITPYYVLAEKGGWMQKLIMLNPISSLIEAFRHAFLGNAGGWFHWQSLLYTVVTTIVVLALGIAIFRRVERNFVDTL